MSLYLILLITSIAVPFVLSFDKKLQFYKQWKFVLPSILIIAFFFLVCDVYLTKIGVWGFNPYYIMGLYLINLPIEEILFFIVIPYASIFLHEAFILYFPDIKLNKRLTTILSIVLIVGLTLLTILNFDKIYTSYIFILIIAALLISLLDKTRIIDYFYLTFLLILVPFFIVNGILTGTFIDGEVVWYNNSENLGIRLLTIPIEDFAYGFSLILFNLLLITRFKKSFGKNNP